MEKEAISFQKNNPFQTKRDTKQSEKIFTVDDAGEIVIKIKELED
jgi:hypothetical protein